MRPVKLLCASALALPLLLAGCANQPKEEANYTPVASN